MLYGVVIDIKPEGLLCNLPIKKCLQIKNRYKLKIKIYDKKFSHKYKYTNCNIFNTKGIYLKIKIFYYSNN